MLSVLRHQNRLYQDQLYNPRAGDAGMWEFYRRVIADHWMVHRSADNGLPGLCSKISKIYAFPAFSFLAAAHRIPDWDRRVYSSRTPGTTPAFHRIPVLACGHWVVADGVEPMWARRTRNYVFKAIRARVCRQWLARVRVEIGRAQHMGVFWCKDGVPDVIAAQLEAWFAAVPHEEVQWSEHDDWLGRYRVIQW
jgi:hypothetical protein